MSQILQQFVDDALSDLAKRGLRKRMRVLESAAEACVTVGSRRCIQLSSNNYLGLTTHPAVCAAAKEAVSTFGTGAGAVMRIAGTMEIHETCERALAALKGTQAGLLMPSGYTANVGTVAALVGPGDLIVSDELNHASIIDGIRLSGADKRIYRHADMDALEHCLRDAAKYRKCLLVTDGVFSMDGDIAPLPAIVALKKKYGAILIVDDAHATGVLGKQGGGSVEHFGLYGEVEIQIGTLSKALAAVGGFVAASRSVIDYLREKSRPFLFSAGMPPSVAASVIAAVETLRNEPSRLRQLWENTEFFKHGLNALGFDTGASKTPITPVIIGDSKVAAEMSERLEQAGVLASEIVFPMVPEAKARLRTIVMATHSREDLNRALQAFERIGKEMGVIN
jgi:glycine C-acetyltransferase